ncbi:copia protein [Nephila pilipes]|uniref:Copia protein n=1 Tax=Nephila pilipes TaxID=299642 RepID=A0A8X6U510_NEPPI|nr:copia protein [Nephila pilipes]
MFFCCKDSSLLQLYHERWNHLDKCHFRNILEKELGISINLDAFKDSFIKFHYIYLIKKKSKVKNMLEYNHAHAKTIEYLAKELLSDNGGEFDNADVEKVLPSKRNFQRLIASYTSEQNGGSEWRMRTVVEMNRMFK